MRDISKKSYALFAAALMAAALFAFAGCASQQAASGSASAASETAVEQNIDVVVGQESSTAKTLVMKNSTGKTITEVAMGETGSEADALNVLAVDGGEWADGKTAAVYYEPVNYSFFDIQLKCGEEVYTLHNFNFDGVENIEVLMEGDVAYVTFERGGNVVSSLSEEMVIHDETVAVEEAAAAEETYYYEESTTYNGNGSAAPAQTEDSCVGGGVVLR